jgi:acetyl-CoA carboxylase beta subunit
LDHGLIDAIIPRSELKERLIYYLEFLATRKKTTKSAGS